MGGVRKADGAAALASDTGTLRGLDFFGLGALPEKEGVDALTAVSTASGGGGRGARTTSVCSP